MVNEDELAQQRRRAAAKRALYRADPLAAFDRSADAGEWSGPGGTCPLCHAAGLHDVTCLLRLAREAIDYVNVLP